MTGRVALSRVLWWFLVFLALLLASGPGLHAAVDLAFTQISAAKFPVIECFVSVTDGTDATVPGLTAANFAISEQSELEGFPTTQSPVDVRHLTGSGGIAVALVIDRSGSMSGSKIADAKQAASDFVALLNSQDQAAVISFSSSVRVDQGFTYDKTALTTAVNGISATGGTNVYDGLYEALQECGTVSGVRVVVVFTDGDTGGDTHTKTEVLDLSAAIGVPIYTIGLGGDAETALLQEIANATGGTYTFAPQASDLLDIYNGITTQSRDQYLLTYSTHNPVFNNTTRTVSVTVTDFGDSDQGDKTYVVGGAPSAPIIGSVHVWDNGTEIAWQQQGTSVAAGLALRISAQITDDVAVTEATLFYRGAASGDAFTAVPMANGPGSEYSGTIPPAGVQDPGVDFYISASDGAIATTAPANDPSSVPYQVAVLPNHSPNIAHTAVTTSAPSVPIPIIADVTDPDSGDSVSNVRLHYRQEGHILFQDVEMLNGTASQYTGSIPASSVLGPGVEYYIVATDSFGVRAFSGRDGSPHYVAVGGSGQPVSGAEIVPWIPGSAADPSPIMETGLLHRYFRLQEDTGDPIVGATVYLTPQVLGPSDPTTSTTDADGVFSVSARADEIGGIGTHSLQAIERVELSGVLVPCNLEDARFDVIVSPLQYSQTWQSMNAFTVGASIGYQVAAGVVSLKGATLGLKGGASFATTLGYEHRETGPALVLERRFGVVLGYEIEFAKAKLAGGLLQAGASVGNELTFYQRQRFSVSDPLGTGATNSEDLQAVFFWDNLVSEGVLGNPIYRALLACIVRFAYEDLDAEQYIDELAGGTTFEAGAEAGFSLPIKASHLRISLPSIGLTSRGASEIAFGNEETRYSSEAEFGGTVDLSVGLDFTHGWARWTKARTVLGLDATLASLSLLGRCSIDYVDRTAASEDDYIELGLGFEHTASSLDSFTGPVPFGATQRHSRNVSLAVPSPQLAPAAVTALVALDIATSIVGVSLAPGYVTAGFLAAGHEAIVDDSPVPIAVSKTDALVTELGFDIDLSFLIGIEIGARFEWVESRTYPHLACRFGNRSPWIARTEEYDTPPTSWIDKSEVENSLGVHLSNLARRAWDRFAKVLGYIKDQAKKVVTGVVEFGEKTVSAVKDGIHLAVEAGTHVVEGATVAVTKLGESVKDFFSNPFGLSAPAAFRPAEVSPAEDDTSAILVTDGVIITIENHDGTFPTTFLSPVQLTLTYTEGEYRGSGLLPEREGDLRILHWDATADAWRAVQSSVSPSENRVVGSILDVGVYYVGILDANARNALPLLDLLTPTGGSVLVGQTCLVSWSVTDDQPSEASIVDIYYASVSGFDPNWHVLELGVGGADSPITWDISILDEGDYMLRLVVTDPHQASTELVGPPFRIARRDPDALVVAPNPVTHGEVAFHYALPTMAEDAELRVFNVAGRQVFRVDLDATQSRWPATGYWTPVDEYGDWLANGPYICVLVADGRVVSQGKMVIRRQ